MKTHGELLKRIMGPHGKEVLELGSKDPVSGSNKKQNISRAKKRSIQA